MVKRRNRYNLNISCEQDDLIEYSTIQSRTKHQLAKRILTLPLEYRVDSYLGFTTLVKKKRRTITSYGYPVIDPHQLISLNQSKSIRKLWHRWNYLIRSIIPDGFQVLTIGTDARSPTALSIRSRIKALVPTAYNCYLLDRDIRRYLGIELRHD